MGNFESLYKHNKQLKSQHVIYYFTCIDLYKIPIKSIAIYTIAIQKLKTKQKQIYPNILKLKFQKINQRQVIGDRGLTLALLSPSPTYYLDKWLLGLIRSNRQKPRI